ncbi:unnamed protein product [Brachionus calyciflorus]|uniref:Uncharacterized protein n=1 Tax=Brachionus calyciflorus TaxID=104777 RepID=A0A813WAU2_9BILA|nr:unnamed protein product [Brachionus calyciflorus]
MSSKLFKIIVLVQIVGLIIASSGENGDNDSADVTTPENASDSPTTELPTTPAGKKSNKGRGRSGARGKGMQKPNSRRRTSGRRTNQAA